MLRQKEGLKEGRKGSIAKAKPNVSFLRTFYNVLEKENALLFQCHSYGSVILRQDSARQRAKGNHIESDFRISL